MNWPALNAYFDKIKSEPFVWGKHDCLTFTNECFHMLHGKGWADDWLGRYLNNGLPLTHRALQKEFGFKTLDDAISSRLKKINYLAPRGALVTEAVKRRVIAGRSFGISIGIKAVFLAGDGLIYKNLTNVSEAYVYE